MNLMARGEYSCNSDCSLGISLHFLRQNYDSMSCVPWCCWSLWGTYTVCRGRDPSLQWAAGRTPATYRTSHLQTSPRHLLRPCPATQYMFTSITELQIRCENGTLIFTTSLIYHLLETSRWDDSNKWSNIGFCVETCIVETKILPLSGALNKGNTVQ